MSAHINLDIQILQENLCELRKIAGWTAEILAGKLGITKQTVSNLENQKVKLSRIQYIAIRAVLECEMASNPSNTTLRKTMEMLFEMIPPVYLAQKDKIRTAMVSIASIAAAGISGIPLHTSATALLAPITRGVIQTPELHMGGPSLWWLLEALDPLDTDTADPDTLDSDITNSGKTDSQPLINIEESTDEESRDQL